MKQHNYRRYRSFIHTCNVSSNFYLKDNHTSEDHLLNADVNYQVVHQESSVTTIYISDYFTITIGIKIVIHIDINISIPYQSKDFETGMSTTEYPLNRRCCWRHHYSLNKTLHQQRKLLESNATQL